MVIRVVGFSSRGYKIRNIFAYESTYPKDILRIGVEVSCQNLGIILVIIIMMLSKIVNNKKCAPKLVFSNEKKNEKDSDNI